jgi:hypothetical protein
VAPPESRFSCAPPAASLGHPARIRNSETPYFSRSYGGPVAALRCCGKLTGLVQGPLPPRDITEKAVNIEHKYFYIFVLQPRFYINKLPPTLTIFKARIATNSPLKIYLNISNLQARLLNPVSRCFSEPISGVIFDPARWDFQSTLTK